ncbi:MULTISPECIES: PilW family protein [Stenotrophomonas]|jgi:type IV pilus assembly protein PilW|uniref:Pilus assembly protein PilW n=3 Tax=Stenotrophomonas TaxID=40323 RepID=A0A4S2CUX2_STEMA|nr:MULTISPECIES: PilW family protein [Stenotrophomonas]MBD3825959.1 PilW family protein [Stenotrophomonas sp.]QIO87666.1 pilus assembly protein PilW [Stenotrophomonas rhizophila]TGY31783.1 pilus assembly protein PilW [Stenotrophomonas maltophilia]
MSRAFPLPRAVAGISLIEVMVAMVIGLVLMLGVIQVFSASREASQLAQGTARAQENARFALEFLQRDIRMAGHFGCVNDQAHFVKNQGDPVVNIAGVATGDGSALDFSVSIQGYEAPSSAPDSNLTLGATWAEPTDLPTPLKSLVPRGGSDVLVLRYLAPVGVPVTSISAGSDNTIGFDGDLGRRLTEEGVAAPTLFGIADCSHADVFVGTYAVGSVTASGATLSRYNVQPTGETMLYRAESIAYYVGTSASGEPVLMRARANAAGNYDVREELVEGIENLQVMYGLDTTPVISQTQLPVGNVTVQGTAADVSTGNDAVAANQWRRVGQVQVGVLARSPNPSMASSSAAAVNDPRLLGVRFVPAAASDGRYRAAYESTIALRNRLFGN